MEMNSISIRVKEISDYFNQLYYVSDKFTEVITLSYFYQSGNIKDTYSFLSKITNIWSESIKSQSTLFDIELREYISYIRKECVQFKEVTSYTYSYWKFIIQSIIELDTKRRNFTKADNKLMYRKEDLFKTLNFPKWELSKEDDLIKQTLTQDKSLAFSKMLPKV